MIPTPTHDQLEALLSLAGPADDGAAATGGTIEWAFTGTEDQFDYLADGESVELKYTIRVTDPHGGDHDEQTVTVTITGTNDAPEITTGPVSIALTELSEAAGNVGDNAFTNTVGGDGPTLSGNWPSRMSTSPTLGHTFTVEVVETPSTGTPTIPTLNPRPAGGAARPCRLATTGEAATGGTIAWAFAGTEDQFDYLAAGESVELKDIRSGSPNLCMATHDEQTVTVTITGSNDAPVITAAVGEDDGSITEGSVLTDSGTISFADVDLTDRPTAAVTASSFAALAQDGTTSFDLTEDQQLAFAEAFDIAPGDGSANDGTIDWDYDSAR